jgi:hypothetical protein
MGPDFVGMTSLVLSEVRCLRHGSLQDDKLRFVLSKDASLRSASPKTPFSAQLVGRRGARGEAGCYFFSKSRISAKSFSSLLGSGGAAGTAGASSFLRFEALIPLMTMKITKAIMTKSIKVCKNNP